MEYQCQDRDLLGAGRLASQACQTAQVQRFDMTALSSQLERCVERAREAGYRVHNFADSMLGPRPENASGLAVASVPTQSLATLVSELSDAIARIEDGLNRL